MTPSPSSPLSLPSPSPPPPQVPPQLQVPELPFPAGLDFYAAYDTFYDHGTWLSLPSKYNSKPFKPQDDAVIVHLHGPRPFHYLEQLAGGRCSYPEPLVCQEGLAGFCRYVERDGLLADMPMYESEAKKGCKALAEGLHTPPTQ